MEDALGTLVGSQDGDDDGITPLGLLEVTVGIDGATILLDGPELGGEEGISDACDPAEGEPLGRTRAGSALSMLGRTDGRDEGCILGTPGVDGTIETDGDTLGSGDLVGWFDKDGGPEGG